jgi:hypothetical protein
VEKKLTRSSVKINAYCMGTRSHLVIAFSLFVLITLMPISTSAQKKRGLLVGTAAKAAEPANVKVVPDIAKRVARFRAVEMPLPNDLTPNERKMVGRLVDACQYLDSIYWRQIDPDALALYQSLEDSKHPRDVQLRRYLWINASRFDLIDENKPFVGKEPMSPGRGFYPPGLTREKVEKYVADHPDTKAEIYSPTTVVRWSGDRLETIPYHIVYRPYLEPAAKALKEAADLSADPAFANYLRLRADALLTDDYFQSDLAWLDLKNPKFDLTFAPYETYNDALLGVKATYGAAVLIRNEKESSKLDMFRQYVPQIQDALPLAPEDRPSKQGLETPMEVMDAPFRSADLTHGYQSVADNLPNDPRVHEQKGSKKLFFENFMDARVKYVIVPVARQMLRPDQAAKVTADGYLLGTIMHEIAHGLGPAFARTPAGKVAVRESIGPTYSGLEEAKADVTGMFGLKWLVDHGALPKERMEEFYASYVGGIFRTVRFGVAEAHGQAEMMEFNYLSSRGAIRRDASWRYAIDYDKMPAAMADLAKELLEIEVSGDRQRAENWFQKYGSMPPELKAILKTKTADIPVDVDPIFSFKRVVK